VTYDKYSCCEMRGGRDGDSAWVLLACAGSGAVVLLAVRIFGPPGGCLDRGTAVCCGCVPRAGAFFTPGTQATGAYSPSPQEATRLSSLRPGVHVGAALWGGAV